MPKYSIVIPVYNAAEWLHTTLDSVIAQTFTDWECICVDDGCTDDSGKILDEYAARDSRFVVVHQKNGGEGPARNSGIERARGEWLALLDNDDIYAPSFLMDHDILATRYPDADMIMGARVRFSGDNCGFTDERSALDCSRYYDVRNQMPGCIFFQGLFLSTYRSDVHGATRFRAGYATDIQFTADCLMRAQAIVKFDKVVYGYRVRTGSLAHSPRSLWKLKGSTMASLHFLKKISESCRAVPRFVIKNYFSMWMEMQVYSIFRQLKSEDRKEAYAFWRATLPDIKLIRNVPVWYRVVNAMVRLLPFAFVARALCEIPFSLKVKGIHR